MQLLQQLRDAGVELVLEDALRGEVFAREGDGLFGPGVVHVVELAEGVLERRPDEGAECAQVGHFDAEVAQGVLHRAGDAQHGVGQRAVEVEEDVSPVHGSLVCSLLCGAKIGIRLRFSKPAEFFRQTGFPPSLFPAVGLPAVPFPSGGLPPQAGRRRFLRQRTLPEGARMGRCSLPSWFARARSLLPFNPSVHTGRSAVPLSASAAGTSSRNARPPPAPAPRAPRGGRCR